MGYFMVAHTIQNQGSHLGEFEGSYCTFRDIFGCICLIWVAFRSCCKCDGNPGICIVHCVSEMKALTDPVQRRICWGHAVSALAGEVHAPDSGSRNQAKFMSSTLCCYQELYTLSTLCALVTGCNMLNTVLTKVESIITGFPVQWYSCLC